MARQPAAAGGFYEAGREALIRDIEDCFSGPLGPGRLPSAPDGRADKIVGLVCPHAGYMYSGSAAAHAYLALAEDGLPDTAVFIGPNHHGLGAPVALSPDEEWVTPLGSLQTDLRTANAIIEHCQFARMNEAAHVQEHSIEVQLPFLQYIGGSDVRIVAIAIAHLSGAEAAMAASGLGAAMARALEGKSAVIIASTDFTHYESRDVAAAQDEIAMGEILKLDGEGLIREVYSRSITMCGVTATSTMIQACKALGATQARKLAYYTSGDVTHDMGQVVGYGAFSIER